MVVAIVGDSWSASAYSASDACVLAHVEAVSVRSASINAIRQQAAAKRLRALLEAVAPNHGWRRAGFPPAPGTPFDLHEAGPVSDDVIAAVAIAAMDAQTVQMTLHDRVEAWRALHGFLDWHFRRLFGTQDLAPWALRARHQVVERHASAAIAAGECTNAVVHELERVLEWRIPNDGGDALSTSRTRLLCASALRERGRGNDWATARRLAQVEMRQRGDRWGGGSLTVQHARVELIRAQLREAEHATGARRRELAMAALPLAMAVTRVRQCALGRTARDTAIARRLVARAWLLGGEPKKSEMVARTALTKESYGGRRAFDGHGEAMLILALALRDLGAEHHAEARMYARKAMTVLRRYAPNSHDLRLATELVEQLGA